MLHSISQRPHTTITKDIATETEPNDAGDDFQRNESVEIETDTAANHRRRSSRLSRIQEMPYVQPEPNPCCCNLQSGVLWIAVIEMVVYSIALGFTAYWYDLVSDFPEEATIDEHDKHGHTDRGFYTYQRMKGYTVKQTSEFIAKMALAQMVVFSINILLSFGLAICAIQRIGVLGTIWVAGLFLTTITRVIIMMLAPMSVFEFGMIPFLLEMYYMYCVYVFVKECRLYPRGVEYGNGSSGHLTRVEPVGGDQAFGRGYQLIQIPPPPYRGPMPQPQTAEQENAAIRRRSRERSAERHSNPNQPRRIQFIREVFPTNVIPTKQALTVPPFTPV